MDLYYPVVFCADGVLRMYNERANQSIAVADISDLVDGAPNLVFLSLLRSRVIVEKGSTLSSVLLCLEPWAREASALTDRDVVAYIEAVKRPSDATNAFDWIEIRGKICVSREFVMEDIDGFQDIMSWLNRDVEYESDLFSADVVRDVCGYSHNDPNNWSISSAPIDEIKNVPVVLNQEWIVAATHYRREPHSPLLSTECTGVHTSGAIQYIKAVVDGSAEWKVRDVIEAVICDGLWYHAPADSDAASAKISKAIEQLNNGEATTVTLVEGDDQRPQVSAIDGAFDSVIDRADRDAVLWERLVVQSRMGVIEGPAVPSVPLEDRIFPPTCSEVD